MKTYRLSQEEMSPDKDVDEDVVCPFCKELGFDLVGLKSHLTHGDCEVFNNLETIARLF